jgi:hypothetical protein
VGTSAPGSPQEAAEAVTGPWRRLGLASSGLSAVVVTPTCGLGATAPALSRVALRTARDAASVVAEASQA